MRKLLFVVATLLLLISYSQLAAQTCAPSGNGIALCLEDSATQVDPVRFRIEARSDAAPIQAIALYVNGERRQWIAGNSLDVTTSLGRGTFNIVAQAWDATGQRFETARTISVLPYPTEPPCSGSGNDVIICSPASGSTLDSPVRVRAALGSGESANWQVLVDGELQYGGTNLPGVDGLLNLDAGYRRITVNAWRDGKKYSAWGTVRVAGPFASCKINAWSPSVSICAPASGTTVEGGRIHVVARLVSMQPTSMAHIYVDDDLAYRGEPLDGAVDVTIPASAGKHRLTVKAWDMSGQKFSSTTYVTVN